MLSSMLVPARSPAEREEQPEAGATLIERCRSGDSSALSELVAAVYPQVNRFIYRLVGPINAREDLVQTALEQVCKSVRSYRGSARFSTFVYGICARVVSRHRRAERVRSWFSKAEEETLMPREDTDPHLALQRVRALADAKAVLATLDAEEREVFVLHELEHQPLEELAAALNCSTRTVKRRLRSAREKIVGARHE